MARQIELLSPNDPFVQDMITTVRKNSHYTLVGGKDSRVFYDLDSYYLTPQKMELLVIKIVEAINFLINAGIEFDRIAFLDKKEGTIGLLPLFSAVQASINKPAIIVRLERELIRNSIKGEIKEGENILILNDAATSGRTLFKAIEKIVQHGCIVKNALVVNDRLQGATEKLDEQGVQLFSLTSVQQSAVSKENIFSKSIYAYD